MQPEREHAPARALAGTGLSVAVGALTAIAVTYVGLRLYGEARPAAGTVTGHERVVLSALLTGVAAVALVVSTSVAAFVANHMRGSTIWGAAVVLLAAILFEAVVINFASFDNFCRYGQSFPMPGFSAC